jgi:hypothetical protein
MCRRSQPFSLAFLAIAMFASTVALAAFGEAPAGTDAPIRELHIGPPIRLQTTISKVPRNAVFDSSWKFVRMGNHPEAGHWLVNHLSGSPGRWAIARHWYQRPEEPGRDYTFAELDSLFTAGKIGDDQQLVTVRYEFVVGAPTEQEAVGKALTRGILLSKKRLDREFRRLHEQLSTRRP